MNLIENEVFKYEKKMISNVASIKRLLAEKKRRNDRSKSNLY